MINSGIYTMIVILLFLCYQQHINWMLINIQRFIDSIIMMGHFDVTFNVNVCNVELLQWNFINGF